MGTTPQATDDAPAPDPLETEGGADGTPDGGDTGEPTGDSTGESTPDDTQAADSSSEGEGEGEGEGEAEGAPSGKKGAYARLLAKYGGDEEKLAEGVWNQANSLSEVTGTLKAQEARINELTELLKNAVAEPEQDVDEIIGEDPSVKEAAEEVRSIDARIKDASQKQVSIIAEHGKLDKLVERLEGKLESMDSEHPQREEIRDKLREARSDRKDAHRDYRDSERDIAAMQRELRDAAVKFRKVEAGAKERVERERKDTLTRKQRYEATRQEFTDAVAKQAKEYGIPTDSTTFRIMHESIRSRVSEFLKTLPKGSPGISFEQAVAKLMPEYVDGMGLESRFQKASSRKQQATAPTAKSTKKGPPPEAMKGREGDWSADYARKRARELLP